MSGGCFNLGVVRVLEGACIFLDLCYGAFGFLMCMFSLLVGAKAVTKQSKNNHSMGAAIGHVIGIGAANAVSGGCFYLAPARGLQDACGFLDLRYVGFGVLMCAFLLLVGT